ncbi:MAG: tRNA (cmo5U34)-methyltransferase [Candidatus Azotimanducaceae bacterium]|jgi:tRNA (cmo5U34)-methyltransferase
MSPTKPTDQTDRIYAEQVENIDGFRFDAVVADVFENMITRSVPGYSLMLDMIGVLADRFAQPNTQCYDLGCSLGAATLKLRQHLPASCHLIGVDTSAAMVERCRANVARDRSQASVEIQQQAVQDTRIENASIVVMNFTLQFIPEAERIQTLKSIADGLVPGGILILAEKLHFEDAKEQAQMVDLHHEFKRAQGYSDLEIAQKRASLENVLIPNTEAEHIDRLLAAGFESARLYVRCFNFVSLLAIKS